MRPGRAVGLSAHQVLAIRVAYPEARIDGPVIRVDRWTMIVLGDVLDLPMRKDASGWHTDGCDEAMNLWTGLCQILGR